MPTTVPSPELATGPTEALSPRARRVAKTRRAIIDAARELIDRQGYENTTIDQIADAADIAPRTFFRYFPSKEALLVAEMADLREQLFASLEARPRTEPPLRSVISAMADYCDVIEANHERLSWGFRIGRELQGPAEYELTLMKAETAGRVTAFLADRLDVDPEVDPRPQAWTMLVMGLFISSMQVSNGAEGRPRSPIRATFLRLARETSAELKTATARLPQD